MIFSAPLRYSNVREALCWPGRAAQDPSQLELSRNTGLGGLYAFFVDLPRH